MCRDMVQLANVLAITVLLLLAGQLKDIALQILLEVRR